MYYYDRDLNGNADDDRLWLHVPKRHLRDAEALRWRAVRDASDYDYLLSLTLGHTPLYWARIDSWWDDMSVLKAPASSPSPSPIDPIRTDHLNQVSHDASTIPLPEPEARRVAWTRYFAKALGKTRYKMLWEGRWALGPVYDYPMLRSAGRTPQDALAAYEAALYDPAFEVSHQLLAYPWPLRIASDPESGRVKRWRKAARQGHLPPVLCMRIEPLLADVILDGHDRMHAALLERKIPEFIRLEYFSERAMHPEAREAMREQVDREFGYMQGLELSQGTVEGLNRRAREAFDGQYRRPAIWTWPLDLPRWTRQVRARGERLPPRYDEILAQLLQEFPEPEVEELVYRREPGE